MRKKKVASSAPVEEVKKEEKKLEKEVKIAPVEKAKELASETVKKVEPKKIEKKVVQKKEEVSKAKPVEKKPESEVKIVEKKSASSTKKEEPKFAEKEDWKAGGAEKKDYAHSWKIRISEESFNKADKVKLSCGFRVLTATKSGEVDVKNSFNKGDKLLVHEDGYPFAVMTQDAFKKRCIAEKSVSTPRDKAEPKAQKPKEQKALKSILEGYSVPLITWFDGQIELWKNRQSNQKISKIMALKSTGEIVIEYTHYDKLLRVADLRYSYQSICPETTKLKKTQEPKRGSYRLLVSKKELAKQYSTNRNWTDCQLWIGEAYECSRKGNCTAEQKELYSLYYKQCGDLRVKEENIAYLRWLHRKAGESWRRGEESYLVAFFRVKGELRTA